MVSTELGKYERVSNLIHKLEEISESFDNSHSRAQSFRLSAWAHYKFRKIDQTLEAADEGIRITSKTGHFAMLLVIWCAKSLAHSARNESEEASKALAEAARLVAERKIMTIYHVPYLMAKAEIELAELKAGHAARKAHTEQIRETLKTIDELIRLSRKMRSASVEAYRMKARACWLLGKQKKAFRYFTLSIRAGQKYNAVLELARTYFEAGKCLREPRSKKSSLLGASGSEYLLKARTLFGEMDLQWDLREYEKYLEG
jgi:tetratricopeptide (TPR) repeat protein